MMPSLKLSPTTYTMWNTPEVTPYQNLCTDIGTLYKMEIKKKATIGTLYKLETKKNKRFKGIHRLYHQRFFWDGNTAFYTKKNKSLTRKRNCNMEKEIII